MFPACSLYSAMVAYSLRKYIWMTFSMCSLSSREPFLDLRGLRPDAVIDDMIGEIGEVHHAGKTLAKPHGIDHRETQSPGRRNRKQTQNNIVERTESHIGA